MELVVEGNVLFRGKVQKLALGMEEGRIALIRKQLKGERHLDYGDRLVLPGAVDAHVHFREPGLTWKEDFLTGTTAASCGGVTAVLDMPNTRPSTTSLEDLKDKLSLVRPKACVDFGLFAGLTSRGRPGRMAGLAGGFKLYLGSTTGDLLFEEVARLGEVLAPLAPTGRPVAVHAEDERFLRTIKVAAADTLSHCDARPPEAEGRALETFLGALGECRGHACHVSSRVALEHLAPHGPAPPPAVSAGGPGGGGGKGRKGEGEAFPASKEEAPPEGGREAAGRRPGPRRKVTCEVTPHHLLLDARDDLALGTMGKMNPPLRKAEDRAELWKALLDGRLDILASDHAPHLEEEKDTDFASAPAGVPGTETMVPLLMLFVKRGLLDIFRLAEAACSRPAEIYGLEGGRLEVGQPANLAVYELREVRRVRGKALHSKCAWSPFEGREAIFPRAVLLRGEPVVEDWESIASPGAGRFLAGAPSPSPASPGALPPQA